MTAILGTAFFTSISSKLKWQNRFNANLHYLIKRKASNIFFVMITQFRWYLTEPLFWCFNPSSALKRYPHPHKCTFIVGLICPPPPNRYSRLAKCYRALPYRGRSWTSSIVCFEAARSPKRRLTRKTSLGRWLRTSRERSRGRKRSGLFPEKCFRIVFVTQKWVVVGR